MEFDFTTAGRILFGRGSLARVGGLAREFGQRALIVTGSNTDRASKLVTLLNESGINGPLLACPTEPNLDLVRAGCELGRLENCEFVIGCGGGSAIDAGKAIAGLMPNPGDVLDYLEVIGRRQALPNPGIPCLSIPTTAGTGSEVTRNAVLASPEHRVKASLRSQGMLPKLALIDPELTDSLPPNVSAASGLDALTQLIEAFLCSRANAFTDSLCREGIRRAARSLLVVTGPDPTKSARDDMSLAALFSGIALANAGLGAVHGLAGPIGGAFPAPHGATCAVLLGPIMEVNHVALRTRAPENAALPRFDEVARLLCRSAHASAEDGIRWINDLVQRLRVPLLGTYGLTEEHLPDLVEKAGNASSMKANPVALTKAELAAAVRKAL